MVQNSKEILSSGQSFPVLADENWIGEVIEARLGTNPSIFRKKEESRKATSNNSARQGIRVRPGVREREQGPMLCLGKNCGRDKTK